jgi:Protein of unknown function (DUF1176)
MQFFSKLSQKQIIGLFAGLFVIFVISILAFVQLTGNQKSAQQNNLSNSSTNSNQNPTNNSVIYNSQSSVSPNSNSAISSQENVSNPTSSVQNSNISIENNPEKHYFKGKIADLPIKIILEYYSYRGNYILNGGKYLYEKQGKIIDLKVNYTCGQDDCRGYLNEFVDNSKTGFFIITSAETRGFYGDNINGTWTNPENTVKLPFSLEKVEKFNLEDFLVKKESFADLKKDNLSVEDRKLWYQKLQWTKMCEDNSSDFEILGDTSGQMEFSNFSDTEFLVDINCNCGAYQCWHNLVYYDEKNDVSKLLEFDSYNDDGNKIKKNLLTLPSFDPKAKTIETLNKYAGHGGCGYSENYEWQNNLKNFELVKFTQNSDCNNPVGEDKWKVIYQK